MEVLEVLNQCTISGNVVTLPNIQLDRKVYQDTAKKIELIGGKWNRSAKGFVFKEDPSELFNDIKNGDNRNFKKEFQFFATPAPIAEMLCTYIPENTFSVLEPSAGQGAIVQAINKIRPDVVVAYCELMELNRKQFIGNASFVGDDFLKIDDSIKYDCIVANPPFAKNQDIDHVRKMAIIARKRVISIMSTHWQHAQGKKETAFREFISQLGAKVIPIEAGEFKESGTNVPTCIVIFDTQIN